jgi:VWFA-related protein
MRRIGAWLCCLCCAAGLGAAGAAAQTFVEDTQVVVVEVPVQVIRDGEPVRGLTAADFEVYDGREKQTLTGFEAVDLGTLSGEALTTEELPVSARRHFLILFDLTFSAPEALVKARKAAREMMGSLHPTDLVAVATWSVRQGPRLVLGFSSDRRQVTEALRTLGFPDLLGSNPPDPLRLSLAEGTFPTGLDTGGMRATVDGETEETNALLARLTEEAQLNEMLRSVKDMSRAMAGFAHMIGGVAGRKNVIFLSEGFDPAVLRGTTDDAVRREQSEQAASGEIWKYNSDTMYGNTKSLNLVENMLEELRRADCVIQAVDIAGLRGQGDLAGRKPAGQDTLLNLAKGTGGELYEKTNDLGGAMQQMLRRTGVTYVLSFQAEKVGAPATFHPLKVKVKNQPRGTRVLHRPGWYAPQPFTARSEIEKTISAASLLLGAEEGGPIRTQLLAVPSPGEEGEARVPVVVEVDGPSLLAGTAAGKLPAEIYVYALDKEGAVHGYMAQTVGLDLAKVGAGLRQSGIKLVGYLDLPPGEYRLRSLVRNGATGATTVHSLPLSVPAFTEGGPVLLPPFFPEPAGRWLTVSAAVRAGQKERPYPFLAGEEPYVPAVQPVLVPGQESRLSLLVYNLGAGAVRVRAKVFGADGKEVSGGHIKLLEHKAGPPDRLLAAYQPPQLPPGTYRLEVALTDGGGASRSSSTSFRVAEPR